MLYACKVTTNPSRPPATQGSPEMQPEHHVTSALHTFAQWELALAGIKEEYFNLPQEFTWQCQNNYPPLMKNRIMGTPKTDIWNWGEEYLKMAVSQITREFILLR